MDYLSLHDTPSCKEYSNKEVFKFNYLIWTVFFFLGLQFTHLDTWPFNQITLDWNVMKNWSVYMWALFLSIMGLIALIAVYICYMYYLIGYLKVYLYALVGLFALIAYLTKLWSAHYHLHIHHYFFGSVCAAFCCYQSGFVTAV